MKRWISFLLALALLLALAGCGESGGGQIAPEPEPVGPGPSPSPEPEPGPAPEPDPDPVPDPEPDPEPEPEPGPDDPVGPAPVEPEARLKLGVLYDSAALGAAGLVENEKYEVVTWETLAQLESGDIDAAIIPVSDAARLYFSTGGEVRLAAVTAVGGWVLVERGETIRDIYGLVDRTVYAPEWYDAGTRIFEYTAGEYGYIVGDTLNMIYVGEQELRGMDPALMPSLTAGSVIVSDSSARIALDMRDLWSYITDGEILPAGCLAVRDSVTDSELDELMADLKASELSVSDNLDAAVDAGMAASQEEAWAALEGCELVWLDGARTLREELSTYFSTLYSLDPQLIGGYIPDDGFYR